VVFHYHRRTVDGLRSQIRAYMSGHMAALLVQYERTNEIGNLRRAFVDLPLSYAWRSIRRIRDGRNHDNCLLLDEIIGCLKGVLYYLRAGRPRLDYPGKP
jgi:hypothetical protein